MKLVFLIVLLFTFITTGFALVIIDTTNTCAPIIDLADYCVYINERADSLGIDLEWQGFPYTSTPDVIIPLYPRDLLPSAQIAWLVDWVSDKGTLVLLGEHGGFYRMNSNLNNILGPAGFELLDSIKIICMVYDTSRTIGPFDTYFTVDAHTVSGLTESFESYAMFVGSYLEPGVNSNVMLSLGDSAYTDSFWVDTCWVGNSPIALQIPYLDGQILLFSDSNLLMRDSDIDSLWPYYNNQDLFDRILLLGTDDIAEGIPMPESPAISAHPNPFNSAVTITIDGVGAGFTPACVEIYDVNGRRVATVTEPVEVPACGANSDVNEREGTSPSPTHNVAVWQPAPSLGSGVYLVRAVVGDKETVSKRVVYLK